MNEHYSHESILQALRGELPPDQEAAFNTHMESCPQCVSNMERICGADQFGGDIPSLLQADEFGDVIPGRDEDSITEFIVEHLEPADSPEALGQLGGYDVLQVIGRGGMGVVLKAYDRELKRLVAIKTLAPHLVHTPLASTRFAREAQAAAAVVNLHVIAIHQVQPTGRLPFPGSKPVRIILPLWSSKSR